MTVPLASFSGIVEAKDTSATSSPSSSSLSSSSNVILLCWIISPRDHRNDHHLHSSSSSSLSSTSSSSCGTNQTGYCGPGATIKFGISETRSDRVWSHSGYHWYSKLRGLHVRENANDFSMYRVFGAFLRPGRIQEGIVNEYVVALG
jgi:hypothetical protein